MLSILNSSARRCRSLSRVSSRHQPSWLHSPRHQSTLASASYNATAIESRWQAVWSQSNSTPPPPADHQISNSHPLTILLPPPNVTGNLHCGHALTLAIQDSLVRYHQITSRPTLWIPGTDHAGIATQSVVERHLAKTRAGLTRHDLGRQAFLDEVWQWKHAHGDRIKTQTLALGAKCNWEKEYFTLDDPRSRIVADAFVALHARGLVYRATRLVHWCPALRTAVSDIEVDYLTITGPEDVRVPGEPDPVRVGEMHTFHYPLVDDPSTSIPVATTRIETMLGDAAVAVHPSDQRYTHLVGKRIQHPLRPDVTLPIVADATVDPQLGTGAVKVTPAHDPDDFELGKRHGLPIVDIMSPTGTFTDACGVPKYVGMSRFAVRRDVIRALSARGLYAGAKPHAMRLGVCSRSGDIIEPRVMPQWYVRCGPMADKVLAQLDRGNMQVVSTSGDSMEGELRAWLDRMQDWCVSRQLWWGHRVPAWRPEGAGEGEADWVVRAQGKHGWVQDDDVLDTWFSSALLPLSATNPQVDVFAPRNLVNYPTSILETGSDILFFWVARMAMVCTELTGQVPFHKVLLHGMVRDAQGRKMSKSLGNVIDPLHVIRGRSLPDMVSDIQAGNLPAHEIDRSLKQIKRQFPNGLPSCGADALRLTLLELASSRQINLDVTKVVANHHFANKLFNVAKFVSAHVPTSPATSTRLPAPNTLASPDQWLLSRLHSTLATWHAGYTSGAVGRSTQAATQFLLGDLSDTYIEFAKRAHLQSDPNAKRVLSVAMQYALVMLYPCMPHVTSEVVSSVFGKQDGVLQLAELPKLPEAEGDMELVFEQVWAVVKAVRKTSAAGVKGEVCVVAGDAQVRSEMEKWVSEIAKVGRVPKGAVIRIADPAGAAFESGQVALVIRPDLKVVYTPKVKVDTAASREDVAKLQKEADRLAANVRKLEGMMSSDKYKASVPETVQMRDAKKVASFLERLGELNRVGVVPTPVVDE
ncbi:tRNA synthetases class I-domain-containing protein [Catenaria anguillulae PL171]|uniref:valine--tRNA ligase n=1 Tax=Catenaria anguillulae PL171 TaxID=765915 RepID=A0A1Y2HN74_9FUNG|nr:tRNA synthetases class I-domain-containing protein [Catenaria anguillulae PL171]